MDLQRVAARLAKGDLHYALGRFRTVRIAYGGIRRLLDGPVTAREGELSTLFPDANIGHIIETVAEEAVFIGLNLPTDIVAEIESFARSEPLHANYDPNGPTFRHADVRWGKIPDARSVPIGGIHEPSRCPAVRAVVDDPVLRAIVTGYLGHKPRQIMTILHWSFASDFTDDERRKLGHHVIDYHYDVGGYNFVYASFYITDTDRNSGAHVMMKRSHNKKPLRMLMGSAVASQDAVRRQYGIKNEITIEGAAGTGFVQDTSCYHRATPPIQRDRLILAVRFIN
jgi:hypothetical protein